MKYDFSDVEFLSSPVAAVDNEYDTSAFYAMSKVSLGAANNFDADDDVLFFTENIISKY